MMQKVLEGCSVLRFRLVVTADNAYLTNMSVIIVHSLEQVVVTATTI